MMKDWRETTEVSGFVISLFLGFFVAFKVVLPTLYKVGIEVMRYLCGLGLGFGLGICFFLIFQPIHSLCCTALKMLSEWIDARDKEKNNSVAKGEDDGS